MDVSELQTHYRSEKDVDVRERLLMIIWLKKGKTTYEVADLLDYPQSRVMYWKGRFERNGISGLRTKSRPGKPPKLLDARLKLIRQKLGSTNSWQTKWVRDLIYQETGVTYTEKHVVRLLHKWGFERITPRKKHERASDEGKESFKKRQEKYWVRYQ
jgi:transposase